MIQLRIQPAAETELPSYGSIRAIDPSPVWEDVCQCALCSELAITLPVNQSMVLRTLSWGSRTLAKYLQGVSTVDTSVECEKGQAFPAWHCPVLKNLQGTCEVSVGQNQYVFSMPVRCTGIVPYSSYSEGFVVHQKLRDSLYLDVASPR